MCKKIVYLKKTQNMKTIEERTIRMYVNQLNYTIKHTGIKFDYSYKEIFEDFFIGKIEANTKKSTLESDYQSVLGTAEMIAAHFNIDEHLTFVLNEENFGNEIEIQFVINPEH